MQGQAAKALFYPIDNGSHEILSRFVGIARVVLYKGHSGDGLAEVRLDVPRCVRNDCPPPCPRAIASDLTGDGYFTPETSMSQHSV